MRSLLSGGRYQVPVGQVRIDWNHPLALDLVGCWVGGQPANIAASNVEGGPLQPNTGTPTEAIGPEGAGWGGGAYGSSMPADSSPLLQKSSAAPGNIFPITYYARGFFTSAPGTHTALMGILYANPNTAPNWVNAIKTNGATPSKFQADWNTAGIEQTLTTTSAGFSANSAFSVGASFNDASFNTVIYQDGVSVGSGAFGGNAPASSATSLFLLGSGYVPYVNYAWKRILTAAEHAWLDSSPYEFLIPAHTEFALTAVASGRFRRTLSHLGARSGSRQVHRI